MLEWGSEDSLMEENMAFKDPSKNKNLCLASLREWPLYQVESLPKRGEY